MRILDDHPVLVVGAGPVGLAVALALRRAGIAAHVIDQRTGVPHDHRATTVQPRVLELLARWGALDAVLQAGVRVERLGYWEWGRAPTPLAELSYRTIRDDTPCPYRVHIDQHTLCDILAERIEASWPGTVAWGNKAVSFEERGDHVAVSVLDREQRLSVHRAPLLVGADGHGSMVRAALGVPISSDGAPTGFISGFVPLDTFDGRSLGDVAYLYDESDWVMVMTMSDRIRLLWSVPAEAEAAAISTEATEAWARRWLGNDAGLVKSLAMYRLRPGVAERWRSGRVLLAGDAAHQAYPLDGTAMNAGMLDADALAGALCVGTDEALDQYAASRKAWSERVLVGGAAASLRALAARGLWDRASRHRLVKALADVAKAREHLLRLSLLEDRI